MSDSERQQHEPASSGSPEMRLQLAATPIFDLRYRLLPDLPPDEFGLLKASIAQHGIEQPIVVDEQGRILDGFMRATIADQLGIACPTVTRSGLSEAAKQQFIYRANLRRRQLDQTAIDRIIEGLAAKGMSVRAIAKVTGIPRSTVSDALARVRASDTWLAPTSIYGLDGKVYPMARHTTQGLPDVAVSGACSFQWPELPGKPYYEDPWVRLYHGDARDPMSYVTGALVVSDPPYNSDFQYGVYRDRLSADDYAQLLLDTLPPPSIVVHYPTGMFTVADALGRHPDAIATWVFNRNLPRQSRSIGWFGVIPDFARFRQSYKNPTDRRIRAMVDAGSEDARGYDWWSVQTVPHGSKERTDHPAQLPREVARRILMVTPQVPLVVDPFSGSSSVLAAAKEMGRHAIGFETDAAYCQISADVLRKLDAPGAFEAVAA